MAELSFARHAERRRISTSCFCTHGSAAKRSASSRLLKYDRVSSNAAMSAVCLRSVFAWRVDSEYPCSVLAQCICVVRSRRAFYEVHSRGVCASCIGGGHLRSVLAPCICDEFKTACSKTSKFAATPLCFQTYDVCAEEVLSLQAALFGGA